MPNSAVPTSAKRRIAVINSHPIQYFAPLYRYINQSPDIEITALYLSDFSMRGAVDEGFGQAVKWDVDLLSGYPYKYVGKNWQTADPTSLNKGLVPEIWHEVRNGGYHALIVHGHAVRANLTAIAAARTIGLPVLMRGESHLGLPASGLKSALRKPILGGLYRACAGFLAIGAANRAYYRAHGVPDERISPMPYTIDNARFTKDARLSPMERLAVRKRYGISDNKPAVLFVSKLMRRKHPDDLVRAAQKLRAEGLEFDLVIAGNGEMLDELKAMVAAGGLANVTFPGFINQAEMPRLLGACDVFALPSEAEPWGLIVNEAMCAGLPIVLSREIGCVPDLLEEGRNGHAFDARDVDGLTHALRLILDDSELRRAMSRRSLEIIGGWSYERCLAGLREAMSKIDIARKAA